LIDNDTLSEAPVLSTDGQKLYYHKKTGNKFNIVLRYRLDVTGMTYQVKEPSLSIYPNPASGIIRNASGEPIIVYNMFGEKLGAGIHGEIDLSGLSSGVYLVSDQYRRAFQKVIKQ
jgi:hypothetical protein